MRKLCVVLVLLSCHGAFAQVWSEDFSGEADGATSGTASGTPGGTWSVASTPSSNFSVQSLLAAKFFFVNNNLTESVWQSNVITLPSPGFATISVELATGGTRSTDYIRVYYKVDGGAEILFAETMGQFVSLTTTGSAYVGGTTLQLVMRGRDTETGTGLFGVELGFTMDNVVINLAPAIYSRKSSTWTDVTAGNGTWSATALGGASCDCTPASTQVAVIGGSNVVTLPAGNRIIGALSLKNAGTLTYNTDGASIEIRQGLVRVESGGVINSSSGAITGEQIVFNANLPGAAFQVDAGGTASLQDLILSTSANNLHYINGGGSLMITGDIQINADNSTLTNNLTTTLSASRLVFGIGTTTNGASVVNNGTITISGDLGPNDATDDNNVVTNTGTMTFVNVDALQSGASSGGDLQINNSGTINQSGTFVDIPTTGSSANSINNLSGGTWNYSGTGHDTDVRLLANGSTNNFNYSLSGAQQIITPVSTNGYNNLNLQASGAKTVLGDFSINGNWAQSGTASFTPATFTVTFNGSGTQTISNSSGETFNNLTLGLNATANTVQLANDITVNGTLTLTTGGLDLNAHQLTITNSATTAVSASANGYLISESTLLPYSPIVWNMKTTTGTYTFPFRDAAGGNSFSLTFNKTTAGTETSAGTGTFSMATFHTSTSNTPRPSGVLHTKDASGVDISNLVADRFWIITPSGYSAVPTATVTFQIPSGERPATFPSLSAQRWNTGSNLWDPAIGGQVSSATSAQVTIPGTFSAWALAATSSPLPIELTDFTARQAGDKIQLNWSTASELNNDFFALERLNSADSFDELFRVKGMGTIKQLSNYKAYDFSPWQGKNYYRLRQTDFDGTTSYSKLISADYKYEGDNLKIYPNPLKREPLNIEWRNLEPEEETSLHIYSLDGKELVRTDLKADANGRIQLTLPAETLASGMYLIRAGKENTPLRKIIIE